MPKIATITFSPAIDKSANVKDLIPEKKLACSNVQSEPGGGGINVSRVLKRVGSKSVAIFPSGGYTGKILSELVTAEQVATGIVEVKSDTRENFVILEENTKKQFRFGMPASRLSAKECAACLNLLEEKEGLEFIVVSGSLPPGVPVSVFGRLAEIAKRKNAKLVVDTSGSALKKLLNHRVYMTKPNLGELASLTGNKKLDASEAGEAARKILSKVEWEMIVVSLGADGAVLVTKNEMVFTKPPQVEVKSTVGAGDSLVAGIVHALASGFDLQSALNFGVACGTATTMSPGTGLCEREDVEILFRRIENDGNFPVNSEK